MGGHGGSDSGSVFRVGENLELLNVLAMVSILVVCIMVAERAVHRAEHRLHKYPKYHEMLTKAFGELTILGFIGLGIKVLKEVAGLDAYSKRAMAFQAADLTVFLVAIALIFQAIIVFLRLRRKNIQADKAELISTQHLADLVAHTVPVWFQEFKSIFTVARRQNLTEISRADIPEVARLRILRHFFLRSYGLPELFPFSKYLRQAQDNQISHMIEVEISTWMVLLLIAWALGSVAKLVDHKYHTPYSIVVAFLIFAWASVLLNIAITAYFTWAVDKLLDAAVDGPSRATDRYLYLNEIAEQEAKTVDRELAGDAIAIMERVREHEQMKRVQRKRNFFSERDTGFQLLGTIFRKIKSSVTRPPPSDATTSTQDAEAPGGVALDPDGEPAPVQGPKIHLRWFSRKAWHFVVMSTLMLNALYVALFCQCVIFQMSPLYHKYGFLPVLFLPLPLIVNTFVFQPRILRNFILVSAIFRVDDTALGEVIDHFTETVQLRAGFVKSVHAYLESTNQTVADVQSEFEARDPSKSGTLHAEDVRLVLHRFGFKLTFFRFNSVAKLLFDFRGIQIEYAQVIRLLEIGQSDAVRSLANSTAIFGEYSSSVAPSSSSSVPVLDSVSPYISGASDLRNNNLLLRAKATAANSLYRMNIGDASPAHQRSPSGDPHHITL